MYKQIKKLPKYALKWMQKGNVSEFFHIAKNVKFKHLLIALAARADRKPTCVQFRNSLFTYEINQFLELVPFRRKKAFDDIYLWDFGQKQLFCNYRQLLGLVNEYLDGLFDEIYPGDWKGKNVVDIGGFVGDTALYFLSQGAEKIAIYEPVEKNMRVLKLNLTGYEERITCFQEALAAKNGPLLLFSNEPEGSSSFGFTHGCHQLQCQGTTIVEIIHRHHPIDLIKIDCEGGEEHLLNMTESEIQLVPHWMIETHSSHLYHQMIRKFCDNGFSLTYDKALNSSVNLLHFVCCHVK